MQKPSSLSSISNHINTIDKMINHPKEALRAYFNNTLSLNDIIQSCLKKKSSPQCRNFFWKMFLNILPFNSREDWKENLTQSRKTYYSHVDNLFKDNNILLFINCKEKKGTNEYEQFKERIPGRAHHLIEIIKLDVDRTFQEIDVFRNEKVKESLSKILYVHCSLNTEPGYCQGMNEILGTIYYAMFPAYKQAMPNDSLPLADSIFEAINDEQHFEADMFSMYQELMSRDLNELYTYNAERYRKKTETPIDINLVSLEELLKNDDYSTLKKRIMKIFYIYLKVIDRDLFDLVSSSIEPDIFLFRWILCLLNREINIETVLWIWDCILAYEFIEFTLNSVDIDKTRLNFLDSLCVAMISDLKQLLIDDSQGIMLMSYFLQFPNEKNMRRIVKHAMEISNLLQEKDLWNDNKLQSH